MFKLTGSEGKMMSLSPSTMKGYPCSFPDWKWELLATCEFSRAPGTVIWAASGQEWDHRIMLSASKNLNKTYPTRLISDIHFNASPISIKCVMGCWDQKLWDNAFILLQLYHNKSIWNNSSWLRGHGSRKGIRNGKEFKSYQLRSVPVTWHVTKITWSLILQSTNFFSTISFTPTNINFPTPFTYPSTIIMPIYTAPEMKAELHALDSLVRSGLEEGGDIVGVMAGLKNRIVSA